MRRALLVGLGLLLAAGTALAQLPVRSYVLLNAAAATTKGLVAHAAGFTVANVQIVVPTGASPAAFTVNFEQSLNDTHYTATLCTPLAGTAAVSSTTATGHWRCNITGSFWFRTRLSAYTGPGAITSYVTLIAGGSHSASTMRVRPV